MTGPRRMSREDVMTAREVADLLGLTERTVYDWARTGRLPSKRLGSVSTETAAMQNRTPSIRRSRQLRMAFLARRALICPAGCNGKFSVVGFEVILAL